FARYFGGMEEISELMNYTINRHFLELNDAQNPALALLEKVMDLQMDLIVNWMRIGFIHGVMNTDNTSIPGETFDYGPCAFMGIYNPETVFSSIDRESRYVFGSQSNIIKWNLSRLAETLLSLIDPDEKKAIELATEKINSFDEIFTQKWWEMMFAKLGISNPKPGDDDLVNELLRLMELHQKDYTNTFTYLRMPEIFDESQFFLDEKFDGWIQKWKSRIKLENGGINSAFELMKKQNPIIIPRNYFVEKALDEAEKSDFLFFHSFLDLLKTPYEFLPEIDRKSVV